MTRIRMEGFKEKTVCHIVGKAKKKKVGLEVGKE